jgi:hypothetical protein
MKSVEFCYWLQGLFELAEPKSLTEAQTRMVKNHLALVFKHEIDPSYGSDQDELYDIHSGSSHAVIGGVGPGGALIRC